MCDSLDVLLPVLTKLVNTSEVIALAVAAAVLIIKPLTTATAAAAVEVDDQIAEVKKQT